MHRRIIFPVASTSPEQLPASNDLWRLGSPLGAPSVDSNHGTHTAGNLAADQAFFEELCQGQSNAWRNLLAVWSPRLYSYVFYNTYNESDAQALLQRTFTLVMRRVLSDSYRLQDLSQLTVLLVSTLYRLILHYQAEFGIPLFDLHHRQQPFDQLQQKFMATLQQLTPTVQQMLLLRYLVGLSVGELTLITGYGIAAVVAILRAAALHFPPATFA